MKIIQFKQKLKSYDYCRVHLSIVNSLLPVHLSNKETEVLACFLSLPKEIVVDDYFNTTARSKVMEMAQLKSGGLSNYINSLLKKGFLEKNPITKRITIQDFLLPEEEKQGYQLQLIKDV